MIQAHLRHESITSCFLKNNSKCFSPNKGEYGFISEFYDETRLYTKRRQNIII